MTGHLEWIWADEEVVQRIYFPVPIKELYAGALHGV